MSLSSESPNELDSLNPPVYRSIGYPPSSPTLVYSTTSNTATKAALGQFPEATPVFECHEDGHSLFPGAQPSSSDPIAFGLLGPLTRSSGSYGAYGSSLFDGDFTSGDMFAFSDSIKPAFSEEKPIRLSFSDSYSPDFSVDGLSSNFSFSTDVSILSGKHAPAAGSLSVGGDVGLQGLLKNQVSVSASSVSEIPPVILQKELDPLPGFVERYTSFMSVKEPHVILKSLFAALQSVGADFRYNAARQRVKGVVYPSNAPCFFKVKLYQGKNEGESCVEFQRRCGDSIAFCQFYRSVLEQVACLKPRSLQQSAPKEPTLKMPNKKLSRFDIPTGELDDSTLTSLYQMACNENYDVQCQAVQVLASVSSNPKHAEQLVSFSTRHSEMGWAPQAPLVSLLKSLLQAEDTRVLRSAALLLRNCVSHPKNLDCSSIKTCLGCQVVECSLVEPLFALLDCPMSLELKDAQRKLASALAQLALSHPDCIQKSDQQAKYVSTLKRICGETGRCSILVQNLQQTLLVVSKAGCATS